LAPKLRVSVWQDARLAADHRRLKFGRRRVTSAEGVVRVLRRAGSSLTFKL